jgi:hypothetical protein
MTEFGAEPQLIFRKPLAGRGVPYSILTGIDEASLCVDRLWFVKIAHFPRPARDLEQPAWGQPPRLSVERWSTALDSTQKTFLAAR